MQIARWLTLFGALWTASARADVVTLAELESTALTQRPELAGEQAGVQRAQAQIGQAESAYWPDVALGVEGSLSPGSALINLRDYVDTLDEDFLISGSQGVGQASAFLPQPRYGAAITARGTLYDFGRTRAAVQAAVASKRAAEASGLARERSIVQEVRAGYVRWAVAHALFQVAAETQARANLERERVEGLISEGAAAAVEQGATLSLTNAAAMQTARASLELESARLDLSYLTARDLDPLASPDPELLAAPPPAADPAAQDAALHAIEQARLAAQAHAQFEAQASTPVLAYRASGGLQGQTTFGEERVQTNIFPSYALGLVFSVPLSDGGRSAAGEAVARAETAELTARAEAERSRSQHTRARREIQTAHAAKLLELARMGVSQAEARIAQLAAEPSLGSAERARLTAAHDERARAQTELIHAQAALAQIRLGLL